MTRFDIVPGEAEGQSYIAIVAALQGSVYFSNHWNLETKSMEEEDQRENEEEYEEDLFDVEEISTIVKYNIEQNLGIYPTK